VKGASGVFRMREKGATGSRGKAPSGGRSPLEAEAFLLMNA